MRMIPRSVLVLGVCAGIAAMPSAASHAAFPERPITIVSPFGAGSSADTIGRLYAQKMSEVLGQSVLIEQKTGAGTTLAAAHVARARPDGYTLMLGSNSQFSIAPNVYANLQYDPDRDLAVVAPLYSTVAVLLTRADAPVGTLSELLDMAAREPEKVSYASFGTGTSSHLMMEMLKQRTGAHLLHVPYKSPQEATTAVLSGFSNVSFETVPGAAARVASGQMKALAIFGPRQYTAFPGVQTTRQAGFEDVDIVAMFALVAPAGTSGEVMQRLREATGQVVKDPEFIARLADYGCDPLDMSPTDFVAYLREESARVGQIAALLDLKSQTGR